MTSARISRWSAVAALPVTDTNGNLLPTAITSTLLTPEQLEAYVAHFRVREITSQLQQPNSSLQADAEKNKAHSARDSSPDPEYDVTGRRTNTRIQRHRRALEAERNAKLDLLISQIPSYQPPSGCYRRPTRLTTRVPIPQAEYPDIKFIGQILGPRGTSLKAMEAKTGATIAVRGKGATKDGKCPRGGRSAANDDDHYRPLHALITADTQGKLDSAVRLVQQVINDAVSKPDAQNERKQQQIRDLAVINGTFRDDEGRRSAMASRAIEGPFGACTDMDSKAAKRADVSVDNDFDTEFDRLMEELGESSADKKQVTLKKVPPWRL